MYSGIFDYIYESEKDHDTVQVELIFQQLGSDQAMVFSGCNSFTISRSEPVKSVVPSLSEMFFFYKVRSSKQPL